jgi:hypothetical protein
MKRWLAFLGIASLLVAAVVALGAAGHLPNALGPAGVLRVGETYVFAAVSAEIVGEVLEEPRGGWVRIKLMDKEGCGTGHLPVTGTWLNLGQVTFICAVDAARLKEEGGKPQCVPQPVAVPSL